MSAVFGKFGYESALAELNLCGKAYLEGKLGRFKAELELDSYSPITQLIYKGVVGTFYYVGSVFSLLNKARIDKHCVSYFVDASLRKTLHLSHWYQLPNQEELTGDSNCIFFKTHTIVTKEGATKNVIAIAIPIQLMQRVEDKVYDAMLLVYNGRNFHGESSSTTEEDPLTWSCDLQLPPGFTLTRKFSLLGHCDITIQPSEPNTPILDFFSSYCVNSSTGKTVSYCKRMFQSISWGLSDIVFDRGTRDFRIHVTPLHIE